MRSDWERWVCAMKWISGLDYLLGILKYILLAGMALFMVYLIGLLRKNVD